MIVFVLWRILKDFGEDATKELAGIFTSKDGARDAGKSFLNNVEEIEIGKLILY